MNAPKLRFKGFTKSWEVRILQDISDVRDGTHDSPKYQLKGYPLVTSKNLLSNGKLDLDNVSYISLKDFKLINERSKVDVGDILFGMIGTIGNPVMVEYDNFAIKNVALIKEKEVKNSFIIHYLKSTSIDKQFYLSQAGGTQKFISLGLIRNLIINVPSLKEQQKIAPFFSLLDQRIEKQQEKIEQLELFKKGMMQKIFSQEIRFRDGNGKTYSEWEYRKLSELGTTYTGLSGKTKEDFGVGKAKFITYMNVFSNLKAKRSGLEKVDLSDGKKQNPVLQGDLLFTTSSETPHEVGMVSYWGFEEEDVYLNSFCFGFRLKKEITSVKPIFLAYVLRSEEYRRKITVLAQGSTRFNLSKTNLMKMKIAIPCLAEQQKIADYLSTIDRKIEKEKEKLEAFNEQKKGFLQQMFV